MVQMNGTNKKKTRIGLLMLMLAVLVTLPLCGCKKKKHAPEQMLDFQDKTYTLGVVDGFIFSDTVERTLPAANVKHFKSREDVYRALNAKAIDGVVDDEPIIRAILRSWDEVALLDGYLEPAEYAFAFPKDEDGEKHSAEFSAFVEDMKASGELAKLDEKWFGSATDNKTSIDPDTVSGENGEIIFAFEDSCVPFAYYSAGKPVGYDIDLAIAFCMKYGYKPVFKKVEFTEMMNGVATGIYDAGCGAITVTEDRKKDHYFATADYTGGVSICVSTREDSNSVGMFAAFRLSFEKAFVEGNRYRLFFRGIGVTLLITFLAVVLGAPFGFILYIMSKRAYLAFRGIAKFIAWVLHGIPVIMLVMALYYTYYKDLVTGGIIAAVIGFMLMFAEFIYRTIRKYAQTCNDGKTEKDYYLLAIDSKEFFETIYRQHGASLIEDVCEGIITVLKTTSVVGYIAVYDMTKVFETIRDESYEVGVPMMITTLVYFLFICLISGLFKLRARSARRKQKEVEFKSEK